MKPTFVKLLGLLPLVHPQVYYPKKKKIIFFPLNFLDFLEIYGVCFLLFVGAVLSQFRGEYEFVEVVMREGEREKEEKMMRLIIDIDFRTQFELARPTSEYQELINALPLIFVGSEEKLEKVIAVICSAAKQSLRERGLHIPPWRRASYIRSKWLSSNCKRVSFPDDQKLNDCLNGNIGCFQDFVEAQKMGIFNF